MAVNPDTEAQRRFEALLDSVGVGVVVFGLDGQVQSANLRAREVFNFPVVWADTGGMYHTDLEVLDEDGHRLGRDQFPAVRALETGETQANVVIGARAAGGSASPGCSAARSRPATPKPTTVTGVICTLVDITEQRASQEAIRASEQRFRHFAENAADVIYRIGFDPLRIEYLNPAITSMLGYSRDDFYRNPRVRVRARALR